VTRFCSGTRTETCSLCGSSSTNALAGTTPPTGDAVIPPIVQKAKDVQRAIKIKMDSGGVGIQDLGIDGGGVGFDGDVDPGLDGDAETEEEEDEAAEEAAGVVPT
jgi:hypothetical protein